MTVLYTVLMGALAVAALIALWRVERGPSILNRAVSVDVITAALIGFTAVFSVQEQRSDLVIIMVALALVGFLSTVTVARFAGADNDHERRILTREELEQIVEEEERLDDDAAPVHDVDALAAVEAAEVTFTEENSVEGSGSASAAGTDGAGDTPIVAGSDGAEDTPMATGSDGAGDAPMATGSDGAGDTPNSPEEAR